MKPLELAPAIWEAVFAEAARCWPREACGVVFGAPDDADAQRVVPMDNLQDRLHAEDPERYPRDARTAYAMDPLKLQRLVDAAEAGGEALLVLFHSHPQHPAYFSRTDRAAASPWGFPTFPDACQVVVSVFDGVVVDAKGFQWHGEDWAERPLAGYAPLPGPPAGAAVYDGEV